jgi:hypothetical protein
MSRARRNSRPTMGARRHRRRGHDALIVTLLALLAIAAALTWLAEHLMVLAGVALLTGTAFCLGQLHERRRAASSRPGRIQPPRRRPEEPSVAPAAPAVMLAVAEAGQDGGGQPARRASRDALLVDPRSGARPLSRDRSPS